MSTLTNVAAIASALAPLLQNLLASSGKASRGRKGPSATQVTIPALRRARPSKRGRRKRGRRKGRPRNQPSGPDFSTGFDRKIASYAAVAGKDYKTYFKQSGTPMHKEWGEGVRYVGCSVLGQMQVPSTGSVWSFNPSFAQYTQDVPDPGDVLYYDFYAAVDNGGALARIIYCLHPFLIPRLQNECENWGRYCFRSIRIHSEAADTTSQTNAYVTGITHDVSWPFLRDQTDGISAYDVAELGNHASGPFYRSFKIRSADFHGDKVWPTALPTLVIKQATTTNPPPSFLANWAENYYQFCYANIMESASTGELTGPKGFVYISYEIDFYSVKTDTSSGSQMDPIIWNDGVVGATVPRPLTKRMSSWTELSADKDKDSKEKEVPKEPLPVSKPFPRDLRRRFPPRSSTRHTECLAKPKEQT